MLTVPEFTARKNKQGAEKLKISMLTCYDSSFAKIVNESSIDCILVGDSSAMVMHGHSSTVHATTKMIATHVSAVARGAPDKFIIGDLPFLSIRKDLKSSVEACKKLIQAGAHAVKMEGIQGNAELVHHLVHSGVPVMGHLGLTPQFVHQLGGMKVQGKSIEAAEQILRDARAFEQAGAFALVLECVPSDVARKITAALTIPTIGIGAGPDTDGQVLVLHDLLGFDPTFKPKFLRRYLNGHELMLSAFERFHTDVQSGTFPTPEESYT
ncbi:MAG: 3-methyl-2-oxobutanoate hydroxymethyltransferase [Methylotenera sp.]|nr:3-methyl-2-oxobutanoate hydroxymethyltransferase [Oligoflexia bacterium]